MPNQSPPLPEGFVLEGPPHVPECAQRYLGNQLAAGRPSPAGHAARAAYSPRRRPASERSSSGPPREKRAGGLATTMGRAIT
jgi:hypothetical protein